MTCLCMFLHVSSDTKKILLLQVIAGFRVSKFHMLQHIGHPIIGWGRGKFTNVSFQLCQFHVSFFSLFKHHFSGNDHRFLSWNGAYSMGYNVRGNDTIFLCIMSVILCDFSTIVQWLILCLASSSVRSFTIVYIGYQSQLQDSFFESDSLKFAGDLMAYLRYVITVGCLNYLSVIRIGQCLFFFSFIFRY